MRIAFETSPLSNGHAGRGIGTYTKQLYDGLSKRNQELTIIPFTAGKVPPDVDIVHYPYFDPFFLTLPWRSSQPFIVTIHDLIPIVYKKQVPVGVKGNIKWQIQRSMVKRASAIITDSLTSKRDIVRIVPFPEKQTHVIYLGPGSDFKPPKKTDMHKILVKYHLPEKYLLYVGDVNWNKNIPSLLQAVSLVKLPIVLVGKGFLEDTPEARLINQEIDRLHMTSLVHKVGFITQNDLPAVYSGASIYVQVSIAEGFGLPVLEAMACGTPAVVSSSSSLSEIAGPSVMVNPNKPEEIANGIHYALAQRVNKAAMQEWLKKFTWKQTVDQTIQVYLEVLAQKNL